MKIEEVNIFYKTNLIIVLISRSLVTRLDAANEYKHSHLVSKATWGLVTDAKYYYIAVSDNITRDLDS